MRGIEAMIAGPVLIVLLSIPLILQKVPKNDLYGFRTRRSLTGSDAEWYRINRICGLALCAAGVVSAMACLILPKFHLADKTYVFLCSGVMLGSLLIATAYTFMQQEK